MPVDLALSGSDEILQVLRLDPAAPLASDADSFLPLATVMADRRAQERGVMVEVVKLFCHGLTC